MRRDFITLSFDSEAHPPLESGPPPLPPSYLDAVRDLWHHGLRLLLIAPGSKKPCWTRCYDRRPGLDRHIVPHIEAGHRVGWIPGDGLALLDVDQGDAQDLAWELTRAGAPPLGVVPSRRPGRGHLVYSDPGVVAARLAGRRWTFRGWAGEIIAGRRDYAVVWDPESLLEAMEAWQAGESAPAPLELLEISPAHTPPEGGQGADQRTASKEVPGQAVPDDLDAAVEALDPSQAWPGNRNVWTWEHCRRWTYRQRWWDPEFEERLELYLDRVYQLIPDTDALGGFPRSEAAVIGVSILSWCQGTLEPWEGRKRDSQAQQASEEWEAGQEERCEQARQDGIRSGEARRARTADRDAEIVQLRGQGWSLAQIGQQVGLTRQGVWAVCRRLGVSTEPLKSPPEASGHRGVGGASVPLHGGGGDVGWGVEVVPRRVPESAPVLSLRGGVFALSLVVGGWVPSPVCPHCPGRHRPDTWCHARRLCPCLHCTVSRWFTPTPAWRPVVLPPSGTGGRCPVCHLPGIPDRRCLRCGRTVQAVPVSSPAPRAPRSPRRPRQRPGHAQVPPWEGVPVV